MTSSKLPSLCLASESPRRRQLLEALGFPFSTVKPEAEEQHPPAAEVAFWTMENAARKATSCLGKLTDPRDIIIAADTLVVLDNVVLGKPASKEDAIAALERLSGRVHSVVTGLVLLSPHFGSRRVAVTTEIHFRQLKPAEIHAYVATSEPYDKAGAYALQGLACRFVEKVLGSHSNTVGLPVEAFLDELERLTEISAYQWVL